MARLPRITIPHAAHHITQRGNRRQQTFFTDVDYQKYLALLREWSFEYSVEVCSFGDVHEIILRVRPHNSPVIPEFPAN